MTPVRNEAWVLRAFLETTSLWADYIIIADQMSSDGSREIALSYPKVILINNDNLEFNEAERQSLLINRAREIEGDKILFGLDADEILSANFQQTNDWQKILMSKPGEVFWFKWAEICPNQKEYWESKGTYYPWMFHDDGIEPHGNYVRNMHSMRIPYPIDENQMHYVDDFRVLHLAYLNTKRVDSKRRFYKFVDFELNHRSCISLSRSYAQTKKKDEILPFSENWKYKNEIHGFDFLLLVDKNETRFWFDYYMLDRIQKNNISKYKTLDIWQKSFLLEYQIQDPRSLWVKLIHYYLKLTQVCSTNKFVKGVDKILKSIV